MTSLIIKHRTLLLLALLLALFLLTWLFPRAGFALGVSALLLSFLLAGLAILQKHTEIHAAGGSTRRVFLRNVLLEMAGTGLAMALAGLLGRYGAAIVAGQIGDYLLRLLAGVLIGLSIGMGVGLGVSKTWERLLKALPGD